ncbi:MAG TPA: hypothetical protein VGI48_02715 [Caldimonas sp.]|jgi:hypothetical protein
MLSGRQFVALTVLGVLALLLTFVNAALFTFNRDSQQEIAQRQQFIQQSVALEGLYREIVKALAELGTRTNDRRLLDILAAQGLSVTVNGAAAPSASAAANGTGHK